MSRNSKKQIVNDEQKVLYELQKDARQSPHEIAKKCGFSRQKVWRIIKKLEKDRIIWGYTAIVDEKKQGMKIYMVLLKRTNSPLTAEVIETVTSGNFKKITESIGVTLISSYYLNGIYDCLVTFLASDLGKAKQLCEIMNKMFTGFVAELSLLEVIFTNRNYGILNPEQVKIKEYFNLQT